MEEIIISSELADKVSNVKKSSASISKEDNSEAYSFTEIRSSKQT